MKEIILKGPSDFELGYESVPAIALEDVRIKVSYCAICATDIRILEGTKKKDIHYPCVIGHEISGIVDKVGGKIRDFSVGDRVNLSPVIPCGVCHACLTGRENVCKSRKVFGYQLNGGFAEYVRVPSKAIQSGNLIKLPDCLSLEEATLVEPLACCVHAVKKVEISANDHVLIIGAGAIGQMLLQLCKFYRCEFVMVSDFLENRRNMAMKFHADSVVNPSCQDIENITTGFDKIFVSCASAAVVNRAISLCTGGGTVILFSGFPGGGFAPVELNNIHYNEIHLTGTRSYQRNDYMEAFDLLIRRKIQVEPLISNIYPIEQFQDAYVRHKSGKGFKVLIQP